MKIRMDIASGQMEDIQVPQIPVGEVWIQSEKDSFVKKFGFIMDGPNGQPYAFTPLDQGFTGIWEGFRPQWKPNLSLDSTVAEWVVSELYTGKPVLLGMNGSVTVPFGIVTGSKSWDGVLSDWENYSIYQTVDFECSTDLREFLLKERGPEYVESYFGDGVNRAELDYWYSVKSLSSLVPCFYQGKYQTIRANVYVINDRAFAIPYDDDINYIDDPFDLIDLVTGKVVGHYATFGDLVTRGMLDAYTLAWQDPVLESHIPAYVPQGYLDYLAKVGRDYWSLATRGIPAFVAAGK